MTRQLTANHAGRSMLEPPAASEPVWEIGHQNYHYPSAAEFLMRHQEHLLTADDLLALLHVVGALWVHSGDPQEIHVVMPNGQHANSWINLELLYQYKPILDMLAHQILLLLTSNGCNPREAAWFTTSPGSVMRDHLAQRIALLLSKPLVPITPFYEQAGSIARVSCSLDPLSQYGFQFEPVVMSGQMARMIHVEVQKRCGPLGCFMAVLPALIERTLSHESGVRFVDRCEIVPLVRLRDLSRDPAQPLWVVCQDECPLCKLGSPALLPTQGTNWLYFVGRH